MLKQILKKLRKNTIILFLFCFLVLLVSCGTKDIPTAILSIYVEDELVEERTVSIGSTIDFKLDDEDYLFLGWYDIEGTIQLDGKKVNGDMDLFAKTVAMGEEYKIIYHMEKEAYFKGSKYPKKYLVGEGAELVNPCRDYDYEFVGWYYEGELITEISSTMYGNIDLYDKWIDNNNYHKITYVCDDDVTYSSELKETLMEGVSYTLPYPIKEGYFFRGWYKDKDYTERVYEIGSDNTSDITLYAKLDKKTAKDTYVSFVGDSISTYHGYIPEDAGAYYPTYVQFPAEKTYFLQVVNGMGYNFLKNNSYGGSRLSSDTTSGDLVIPCALKEKRINGLSDGVHDPDILIVHLGTNEYSQGVDQYTFKSCAEMYVRKIRAKYDDCEIYFCLHPYNGYGEAYVAKREAYNQVLIDIQNEGVYDIGLLDLRKAWDETNYENYIFSNAHPNEAGFKAMADVILEELRKTHTYE